MATKTISERTLVLIIGAVQFINVLDFVMVMPLGPKFSVALGFPASELGLVGGAYTASAAVAGLVGALFLERFDRRPALGISLLGLVAGTALGGFSTGLWTLVGARLLAGAFGGPATSLALTIIADAVPPERRGKALGSVMGAFSVASVVGVPVGLRLAEWGDWRLPFFCVAGLGVLITATAVWVLPPLKGHLHAGKQRLRARDLLPLLEKPDIWSSFALTALSMFAGFLIVPNMATYMTLNLGYPANRLDVLYLAGGVVSFVTLRLMGRLLDRTSSTFVGSLGSGLFCALLLLGFVRSPAPLPLLPFFMVFFLAMGTRNVSVSALTSKVPLAAERARFMSLQSSVQHMASALGAVVSSRLLGMAADQGALTGMPRVGWLAVGASAGLPLLLWNLERRLRRRPPVQATPVVAP